MLFPQGESQANPLLYFTPDDLLCILVPQLGAETCSAEEQKSAFI